jgi:hypothetical protein
VLSLGTLAKLLLALAAWVALAVLILLWFSGARHL